MLVFLFSFKLQAKKERSNTNSFMRETKVHNLSENGAKCGKIRPWAWFHMMSFTLTYVGSGDISTNFESVPQAEQEHCSACPQAEHSVMSQN
jgi:hypothetical protein